MPKIIAHKLVKKKTTAVKKKTTAVKKKTTAVKKKTTVFKKPKTTVVKKKTTAVKKKTTVVKKLKRGGGFETMILEEIEKNHGHHKLLFHDLKRLTLIMANGRNNDRNYEPFKEQVGKLLISKRIGSRYKSEIFERNLWIAVQDELQYTGHYYSQSFEQFLRSFIQTVAYHMMIYTKNMMSRDHGAYIKYDQKKKPVEYLKYTKDLKKHEDDNKAFIDKLFSVIKTRANDNNIKKIEKDLRDIYRYFVKKNVDLDPERYLINDLETFIQNISKAEYASDLQSVSSKTTSLNILKNIKTYKSKIENLLPKNHQLQMDMNEIAYYYKMYIFDNDEIETVLKNLQKFFDQYEKDKNLFKLENDLAIYIRNLRSDVYYNEDKEGIFIILKYEQENFENIKNKIILTAISKLKHDRFKSHIKIANSEIEEILKNYNPKHLDFPNFKGKIVKIWNMKNKIISALRRIMYSSYYQRKSDSNNERSRLKSLNDMFEIYFNHIYIQTDLIRIEKYIEANIKYIKEKLPENIIIQQDIEKIKVVYDRFIQKFKYSNDLDSSSAQKINNEYLWNLSRFFQKLDSIVTKHKQRNDQMVLYDLETKLGELTHKVLEDQYKNGIKSFNNDKNSDFKEKDIFAKFFKTAKNKLKDFEGFKQIADSAKAKIDTISKRDKLDKIQNDLRTIFENYYTRPITYGKSRDSRLSSLYMDLTNYFEKFLNQSSSNKITHL